MKMFAWDGRVGEVDLGSRRDLGLKEFGGQWRQAILGGGTLVPDMGRGRA